MLNSSACFDNGLISALADAKATVVHTYEESMPMPFGPVMKRISSSSQDLAPSPRRWQV